MNKLIRVCVDNPVAVNIVMFAVIALGLFKVFTLVREFFPPVAFDRVLISTPYPGATPEEVEKGLITKIENAIEGVDNIEEITSIAYENVGLVIVKSIPDADLDMLAEDLRVEVDNIQDLPEQVEESTVDVIEQQVPVISVVIYGSTSERRLKRVAEEVKDELLAAPLVSRVMVSGTRAEEIAIEVEPQKLEAYGLTLAELGGIVAGNNVDLAGGEIDSPEGKVLVRTLGEETSGLPLEDLIVRSDPRGRTVRLAEVATVRDGFEETALRGKFRGQRAVQVTVFKRVDEDAVAISRYVKDYLETKRAQYAGEAINFEYRTDLARFIEQRIALLTKNAFQGLTLVFIALGLFLSIRIAFWVGVSLVVAALGTFIMMALLNVSINLISLLGLILVIGLLVDDAIIVAENIYARFEQGMPPHAAAVEGAQEVAQPVLATGLTTMAAFAPLAYAEGVLGDFFFVLPIVVVSAIGLSVIDSFTFLPSHLAEHGRNVRRRKRQGEPSGFVSRTSGEIARLRESWFGEGLTNRYEWFLRLALEWRYVTIAAAVSVGLFTVALIAAGWLPFVLIQRLDADTLVAEVEMTSGTPAEETEAVLDRMASEALKFGDARTVYQVVGFQEEADVQVIPDPAVIGEVIVELYEVDDPENPRVRPSREILNEWREAVGPVPGALSVKFRDRAGGPPGAEIELKVSAPDDRVLRDVVLYIRDRMNQYVGVTDIEDDGGKGKMELRLTMRPTARAVGLTELDIAQQVRSGYFGYEAQVLQRDREEVEVWVRLDAASRAQLSELLRLRLLTPAGHRVPLGEVANVELGRGVTSITRVDGFHTTTITADVDFALANTAEVTAAMEAEFAGELEGQPALDDLYPGVTFSFEGAKKETNEGVGSLQTGFLFALIAIYCILAVLFKSYLQPFMVMCIIPFAIVGACLGHLVYGFLPGREELPITFLSLIGMVGLSGIVVNDSLILVSFINETRRSNRHGLFEAVVEAGRRRFRPILLTSVTTVLGLFPLMLETSFQAQFLIPMAISISFGLALATVLTLLLLPCFYLVLEDLRTVLHWLVTGRWEVVRLTPAEFLSRESGGLMAPSTDTP